MAGMDWIGAVDRLQDISEADALAEGVELRGMSRFEDEARGKFKLLWDRIYKDKPEYQWASNPWVWAISFERIEKPEVGNE